MSETCGICVCGIGVLEDVWGVRVCSEGIGERLAS